MSDFDDEPMASDEDVDIDDNDGFGDVDDVDVDDYAMDNNLNQSQEIRKVKSYEILNEEELAKRGKVAVAEVKDILGIPSKAACLILLRWNKEKLIEAFTENSEKTLKEAGVNAKLEKKPSSLTKNYKCLICEDEAPGKSTYALGCGHRYCLDCWKNYLDFAVKEGADCIFKRCPSPKCNTIVHDKAYKKLVTKQTFATYKRFLNRSLVTDNPLMKFCPAPGCSAAIRCERKNRREAVKCSCGFAFCFQCADFDIGDHMPATCGNVRSWQERASSESENIKWLIANTKRCPTCSKPIEKNGGCMHMTCRKNAGGCGHEFCWLCRGPWNEHGSETGGYYACNKYNASGAKDEDLKSEAIKTELEAYMFYYHRYDSHKQAMKVADEQRRTADNKAGDVLGKFTVRAQDTKFLREATEQLIMNRRVLMWSYVYGFYLKDKEAEKKLFEFLQEDLEKHTNKLSEIYEKPLEQIADYHVFMKWKEDVTNYTRVTSKFLEKFVEGVARGLTAD